jgi:hypothetical protein
MKMLNVSEVLTRVEKEGLTTSRQVVLRWIRQGDLPAVQETRKKGYQVSRPDLDAFIARKKAALFVSEKNSVPPAYTAGYQAALKELLDTAMVSGAGDLFLFRKEASIPIHLADFKEMAARNFSTGKNNPFYQTAIKNLFHPFGRKTPENIIYVYPLGDYYKLANLTVSKEELADFQKQMDFEGASLSDVFANLYLYYLTEGKVKKLVLVEEGLVFLSAV